MIEKAIEFLKENNIEAFELAGILTIPCDGLDKFEETVNTVQRLLKKSGYEKSWRVDPYHYERQRELSATMFKKGAK